MRSSQVAVVGSVAMCSAVALFAPVAASDVPDAATATTVGDAGAGPIDCSKLPADWIERARKNLPTMATQVETVQRQTDFEGGADLSEFKRSVDGVRRLVEVFQKCADCNADAQKDPSYTACLATALQMARGSMAQAQQGCRGNLDNVTRTCSTNDASTATVATRAVTNATNAIDTETQCRASPTCVAARAKAREAKALNLVCFAVKSRAQNVDAMARERANPSGVVNLVVLHDLGAAIQSIDTQLPTLKANYTNLSHKPFVASACPP